MRKYVRYAFRNKENGLLVHMESELRTWTDTGEAMVELEYFLHSSPHSEWVSQNTHIFTTDNVFQLLLMKEFVPCGVSESPESPSCFNVRKVIKDFEVVALHCVDNTIKVPTTEGIPQNLYELISKDELLTKYHTCYMYDSSSLNEFLSSCGDDGYPEKFYINIHYMVMFGQYLDKHIGFNDTFNYDVVKTEFLKLMVSEGGSA